MQRVQSVTIGRMMDGGVAADARTERTRAQVGRPRKVQPHGDLLDRGRLAVARWGRCAGHGGGRGR